MVTILDVAYLVFHDNMLTITDVAYLISFDNMLTIVDVAYLIPSDKLVTTFDVAHLLLHDNMVTFSVQYDGVVAALIDDLAVDFTRTTGNQTSNYDLGRQLQKYAMLCQVRCPYIL
jgi:hypothetical protein